MKIEKEEQEEINKIFGSVKSNTTDLSISCYNNTRNEIFIAIGDIDVDILNYMCIALTKENAIELLEELQKSIKYLLD